MTFNQFMRDKIKYGNAGQRVFRENAGAILDIYDITNLQKMENRKGKEGDFRVSTAEKQWIVEVKADTGAGFLNHGNLLVQLANDSRTQRGWIADIQASLPPVDIITYICFADRDCSRPYAAISFGAMDFVRYIGCSGYGCQNCSRQCQPDDIGRYFPALNLYPAVNPNLARVNLLRDIVPNMRTRIVVLDRLADIFLDFTERKNLQALFYFADFCRE